MPCLLPEFSISTLSNLFLSLKADIDHFVCHEDLLLQMKTLMGLLREKTPKKNTGTVGSDVTRMVRTYCSGITVDIKKVPHTMGRPEEPDYAYCDVAFGYLHKVQRRQVKDIKTLHLQVSPTGT